MFEEDQEEVDPVLAGNQDADDAGDDLAFDQIPKRQTLIWGTDISVDTCVNVFRTFLEVYGQSSADSPSYYQMQLENLRVNNEVLLNLNCSHLKDFPPTRAFYHQLVRYPQEIIPILDHVVHEQYVSLFQEEPSNNRKIQVRTYGLTERLRLRALDPENIEQLLCIKGMVIRCSSIIPDLKQAFFRCVMCFHGLDVAIDRGRIEEPRSCPQCQAAGSMELIHNRCLFSDKQLVRVQETPDEIPEGETPQTVTIFAFDDLVDKVRPGDRIEITGIFRAIPRRVNPRLRTVKSVYKTYIDAIHFRPSEQDEDDKETIQNITLERMLVPSMNTLNPNHKQFSNERIAEFYRFAQSDQVLDRLVKAFAPSIWEMDDVKKGLLCMLFGGTIRPKNYRRIIQVAQQRLRRIEAQQLGEEVEEIDSNEDIAELDNDISAGIHQRGDINILLCGDPGTSKSQLLGYVHKLSPRGIYTSGKGSSAVGLTASVVRDPETRDMVLESGALVLSDHGICCIDEFDKMSDQTRAILHEAMEQQTVSITKAGIIATLNARTSILASANPVQSRYNPRLSVVDNIKLPPTLLSRFDLIYLILDKPNPDTDRKLAQHLVSLYFTDDNETNTPNKKTTVNSMSSSSANVIDIDDFSYNNNRGPNLDQKFLRDYILYAKLNIFPEITPEAEELLVRDYLDMRALGNRGVKTITATPRQLESLIRLAQALAKMRLSNEVTIKEVTEATRLMKVATQTAATDPRTGTIDMDLISTGKTALDRDLVIKLAEEIKKILSNLPGQRLTIGQIRQRILEQMNPKSSSNRYSDSNTLVSMLEVEDAVRELEAEGVLQYIERSQTVIVRMG